MDILHQLGELFLDAVPTVVIVLLFYFFLRWAFFKPIEKVMAKRKALIEGARAEAAAAETDAKKALESYDEAMNKAWAEIYAGQQAARHAVLEERARLVKEVRARAQQEVDAAKGRIAGELEAARAEIEKATPELGKDIARVILQSPPPLSGGTGR
jgi:F-type H+-transporting ATPase subunit b